MSSSDPVREAEALRRAGLARQAEGRFADAVELLRRAVEAAPGDPASWTALAAALLVDRRPEAALAVCERGLQGLPRDPPLLCAKARVLQSLSRVGEAADAYRAALAADPACAEARFGLALQAVEAGDWDAAETLTGPLRPTSPTPALSWLAARIAVGRSDFATAESEARQALASGGLSPDQTAETALLLGEALDGLGRPAEAFAAFRQGKSALRALYAERARGREGETEKLQRLAGWFAGARPADWSAAPGGAAP